MKPLQNDLILRAARRQPVERTPVWMMRQAGRYLPEYRAVREGRSFLEMCKTPELATEVTLQPVDLVGVDAAIIFSDILVIPEAMGSDLELIESKGPVIHNPVRTASDVNNLNVIDAVSDLSYVMDALKMTKQALGGRVPLIGFSGAPWTLLTYMVEGASSKTFRYSKSLIRDHPETAHKLLKQLSFAVSDYLIAQAEAGADVIQIFDTWASALDPVHYEEFGLQYIEFIVDSLKILDVPIIVFAKGATGSLDRLSRCGAQVLGLDWTVSLDQARELTGGRVALQGNFDPSFLYASPESIEAEVKRLLDQWGPDTGHIFNLGHGILPDVPPDHARALVRAVKKLSVRP